MEATGTAVSAREAILDAAERLLERYGYRKSTVDDLAREAGIGKGTVYLHFPSKEEAFLGTVDRIVDRLASELGDIAGRRGPARERLRDMLVARVMVRFDAVRRYPASLDEIFEALRPALLRRRERYFADEAALLAAVVAEIVADGGDHLEAARSLVVATNGMLPYSLRAEDLGEREAVARRAAHVADLLVAGLHANHGKRGKR